MEEYTRQIVTEECFENVADLRALTPEEYQLFSTRVGLKLGQARKLQKRLGMQVDTGVGGTSPGARKTGAADSADSSAGAMIGISSSKDTKTSSQSEEEVRRSGCSLKNIIVSPPCSSSYKCAYKDCPALGRLFDLSIEFTCVVCYAHTMHKTNRHGLW